MRGLIWTVSVSLLLIVGIGVFSGRYSDFVSDEMRGQLTRLEEKIRDTQWTEASQMAEDMEKSWQRRGDVLSMWVNHADVDDVRTGLKRLRVAIRAQDALQTFLSAADLSEALDHVYHRDALRLKNIL